MATGLEPSGATLITRSDRLDRSPRICVLFRLLASAFHAGLADIARSGGRRA